MASGSSNLSIGQTNHKLIDINLFMNQNPQYLIRIHNYCYPIHECQSSFAPTINCASHSQATILTFMHNIDTKVHGKQNQNKLGNWANLILYWCHSMWQPDYPHLLTLNPQEKFNSLGKFMTDAINTFPRRILSNISYIGICAPRSMLFEPFWSENRYRFWPFTGYGFQGNNRV